LTGTRMSANVSTIGRFATRSLERSPFALHVRGTSISIRSEPPIVVQLDGDVVGCTPASLSIFPVALDLIVPG